MLEIQCPGEMQIFSITSCSCSSQETKMDFAWIDAATFLCYSIFGYSRCMWIRYWMQWIEWISCILHTTKINFIVWRTKIVSMWENKEMFVCWALNEHHQIDIKVEKASFKFKRNFYHNIYQMKIMYIYPF